MTDAERVLNHVHSRLEILTKQPVPSEHPYESWKFVGKIEAYLEMRKWLMMEIEEGMGS